MTGNSALNLTDPEAAAAEVGYALFDSMKELAASQRDDNAAAHDEPVTRARRAGPAKARRSRPVSVANELKKLAALRDDDVISEQEFQTLKQQLIEGD